MQHLQKNTTLQGGKYRIERVLGQGGFGITYRAMMKETASGKLGAIEVEVPVAIKEFFMSENCMRSEGSSYVSVPSTGSRTIVEQYRKKFVKEANNMAELWHPNIVRVIDVFEENGTDYYVMEYLEGGSLRDLVKQKGRIAEEEALRYVSLIGYALNYMHTEKHMCHFDVKPSNIMLDKNGVPKLIDFGISKSYDSEGNQTSSTPVGISKGFAPLEQYQQSVQEFSPQTDIYALGATLYYLLTGNVPPEASIVFNDGLPELPSSISASTCQAIEKAMQPRKKDRPQTIKAFLELLQGSKEASLYISEKSKPEVRIPIVKEGDEDDGTYYADEGASISTPPYTPAKPKEDEVPIVDNNINLSSSDSKKTLWVEKLLKKAQDGDIEAQFTLGQCYFSGLKPFPLDYSKAFEWFAKAAEQGDPSAQNHLGICYSRGSGTSQDYNKAIEWYSKAAEQGDEAAKMNLEELKEALDFSEDLPANDPIGQEQPSISTMNSPIRKNIWWILSLFVVLLVILLAIFLNKTPKTNSGESIQTTTALNSVLQNLINNMVYVEGGTFTMGATTEQGDDANDDERPTHQVTLSTFLIGKYEVTQEEWEAVMGSNPSHFKGAKLPVEQVSWDDCQEFIRKLNELTGSGFRLPTEAEWEYAARGNYFGFSFANEKYAGGNNLDTVAWYRENSGFVTHEVGQKFSNSFGLYDMSGNVSEWCSDWYSSFSSSAQINPKGSSSGSYRVCRGGEFSSTTSDCRVSVRLYLKPSDKVLFCGLRLAI